MNCLNQTRPIHNKSVEAGEEKEKNNLSFLAKKAFFEWFSEQAEIVK